MSEKCGKWVRNPLINPTTGRKIKKTGAVFRSLSEECAQLAKFCDEWWQNDERNPRTGRKIKLEGPVFEKLREECGEKKEPFATAEDIPEKVIFTLRGKWLKKRFALRDEIVAFLRKRKVNDISEPKVCVSGTNLDFKKSLDSIKIIGKGTFGDVYSASAEGLEFVVKEAHLRQIEIDRLSKEDPNEYRLLKLTNTLLTNDSSPNFPFIYDIAFCNSCFAKRKVGWCYLTFLEIASGDLLTLRNSLTVSQQYSILYQCLLALHCIHSQFGIHHRDIKLSNFLYKKIPPGGYLEYVVGKDVFYVENTGILILMSDFGVAHSLLPKFQSLVESCGTRNAKVLKSKLLLPITCKFTVERKTKKKTNEKITALVKPQTRSWNAGIFKGTSNTFDGVSELFPSVVVDLNDPMTFPPFEFFDDIQDCLRMFVGGSRTVQSGLHNTFMNVSPDLKRELLSRCIVNSFPYNTYGIRFLIAVEMLKEIYKTIPRPSNISNTFVL